jgi:heme oxygenase (biliverdin-IX-beta and delta-forming)
MASMSQHALPSGTDGPAVPEPTYAERARTLLDIAETGTLSTMSRKHPGHPFGSLMPYALDAQGRPTLLISAMAMHTQNLLSEPRASLFVAEPTSAVTRSPSHA